MNNKILNLFCEDDYKGEHEAPDKSNGSPMHNVSGIYPEDFYDNDGLRQYAYDDYDKEVYYIVKKVYKRPNTTLYVYRAIPKGLKTTINTGDWVTPSLQYAKDHGRDNLNNSYKIIKKKVHARDLFTDGNSLSEWGYDPQEEDKNERLKSNIRRKIGYLERAIRGEHIILFNKYENDPYYGKTREEFEQMLNDIQLQYKDLDYKI